MKPLSDLDKTAPAARRPRRAIAKLIVLALAGAAIFASAAAEAKMTRTPPLPHLRPGGPAVAAPLAADPAPEQKGGLLNIFKKPVVAKPSGPSRFGTADQKALAGISAFFNSFTTMEGQFIQFGPHGEQSEGKFYISRPGKVRFNYAPPVKQDVVADGRNVAIRDNRLKTQEIYPLSKTPLRYLLAKNVDLTSDKLISQVRRERDLIAVVILDKSAFGSFKLTLIFDPGSFELKQWIVTDPQGLNTSTAIYNTEVNRPADATLFRIAYSNRP